MEPGASQNLAGKTVLITGATRGIGLAAADALARMGASIIVHGRSAERVDEALASIERSAPGSDCEGIIAELGSLDEVRALAAEVSARHDRLDILINNAGLTTLQREETVDGFERQLAVNHLAPFLLTRLLLDQLRESAPARIVNVSSNAHFRAAFDIDDLNWVRRRYSALGAYGATKLANILFTRELARRLDGTGITVNCLHPGVVATHIFAGLGFLGALFGVLSKPFLLNAAQGARTTVHLASSEAVANTSGLFFNKSEPATTSSLGRDDDLAQRLWQISEQLVDQQG